ncbi:MAG: hypothetical protein EOP51_22080 [Sphingobacteriales bacterium]|nr:MAG: hypothetical protein EOP51_22080 [Sphingobacteriales bacterium]
MKVENPAAFCFIMQDDIYLLNADKQLLNQPQSEIAVPVNESEPVIETQKPAINYFGKNLKYFVVLVFYPAQDVMNDGHFTALQSTLQRIGLSIDDIAIVNLAITPDVLLEEITAQLSPQKILILGKDAVPAGSTAMPFNVRQTAGNIAFLHTFSFGEMMTSNENKKAFWEQVKNF